MAGALEGTYLDRIIGWHRARAEAERRPLAELVRAAARANRELPPRPFAAALAESKGVAVIAEVKRRSPSKGDLAPRLDPAEMASSYEAGGASCLSVLTDREHFGGSREDLEAARAATSLPVLRKDFTVSAEDVYETRAMGADAILLIVAALEDSELSSYLHLAGELGLDALVEVHDANELERATAAGARLLGVNQRDLHTFEVDRARAKALSAAMPAGSLAVAESGLSEPCQLTELAAAGFAAVLIGESFVTAPEPREAVAAFVAAGRAAVPACG